MADCEARRLASQEYRCHACGLRWDADDPDPPACGKASKVDFSPPVVSLQGSAIMGGKPVARASLVDRLAALCENMRAGVLTTKEAADILEDLTVEVGMMRAAVDAPRA